MTPTPFYTLKDLFFYTTEQQERLMDAYRAASLKRGRPLRPQEKEAVMAFAWKTSDTVAKHYYRKPQSRVKDWFEVWTREEHTVEDRLLIFLEHMIDRRYTYPATPGKEHRSSGWMFITYKRRFSEMETLRELRRYCVGVGMDKSIAIRHWTEASKIERMRVDIGAPEGAIRTFWEQEQIRLRRPITERRWSNFVERYERYRLFKSFAFNSTERELEKAPTKAMYTFKEDWT
jgi:hypothetical protein